MYSTEEAVKVTRKEVPILREEQVTKEKEVDPSLVRSKVF